MSRKFDLQGCQWYEVKQIKSIFAEKGIVKQDLGRFFISLCSSHFFQQNQFRAVSL